MTSIKEKLIERFQNLSDNLTWSGLHDELYLLEQIEKGEIDMEQGRLFTDEQLQQKVKRWQTSFGQKTQS